MKSFLIIVGILFLYGYFLLNHNRSIEISVAYVIDGDTFKTQNGHTVRLWGIDTPERDEAFYQTAKLTLEQLIDQNIITCAEINKGNYARDVMRCYAGENDIGAILVKKGLAKDYDSVSKIIISVRNSTHKGIN